MEQQQQHHRPPSSDGWSCSSHRCNHTKWKNQRSGLRSNLSWLRLECIQHFLGVAVHFDFTKDGFQLPCWINHKGAALETPIGSPIHVFKLIDPISFRDCSIFIAQQCEGQLEFSDELLMRGLPIHAYTEHHGAGFL